MALLKDSGLRELAAGPLHRLRADTELCGVCRMGDLGSRREFARLDSCADELGYTHVVLVGLFAGQEVGPCSACLRDALNGLGGVGVVSDVEPGAFLGYRVDLGQLGLQAAVEPFIGALRRQPPPGVVCVAGVLLSALLGIECDADIEQAVVCCEVSIEGSAPVGSYGSSFSRWDDRASGARSPHLSGPRSWLLVFDLPDARPIGVLPALKRPFVVDEEVHENQDGDSCSGWNDHAQSVQLTL